MRGLERFTAGNAALSAIDTRLASRQVIARFQSRIPTVAKPELGTKRVCPVTGRKFYDLNKDPVISPYTGQVVPIETTAPRGRAEAARAAVVEEAEAPEAAEAEFVSLEEADAEAQGGGAKVPAGEAEEEVEVDDESLDDAAFIVPEEEEDEDVTDIIGGDIEDEEES